MNKNRPDKVGDERRRLENSQSLRYLFFAAAAVELSPIPSAAELESFFLISMYAMLSCVQSGLNFTVPAQKAHHRSSPG